MIIQVSERRRLVIGSGVKKEGDEWVPDPTKARVSFQKLKKGEWLPAKGLQFDRVHKDAVAAALKEL